MYERRVLLDSSERLATDNLVLRVSRARRDPCRVWSRAFVTIENTREESSLNKEFVALNFFEFRSSPQCTFSLFPVFRFFGSDFGSP